MARINPTIFIGKTVRSLARLRGGGSALPGLVIEKLQPSFLKNSLAKLPKGVVVITGTNGKTTTAKIVAQLLSDNGLKVLTNPTGSNFTRGIVAAVVEQMDLEGNLDFDIAVIELDEAYAKQFIRSVKPDYVLALNVMRDQLDRFGELDATAKLIEPVLEAAETARVVNFNDPHLEPIGRRLDSRHAPTYFFGVEAGLKEHFPSDDELQFRGEKTAKSTALAGDVELAKMDGQAVAYRIGSHTYPVDMKLSGIYNFQNAAGALALVKAILPDVEDKTLVNQLGQVAPAFGRGEKLTVGGQPIELVLVKNPAGFRLSLASFVQPDRRYMIAINDNYADGRDLSWLWDVEFDSLKSVGVEVVSGIRAEDMALRLQYDEVPLAHVEPNLRRATRQFANDTPPEPKVIFATYTAMLAIRRELATLTNVERVL